MEFTVKPAKNKKKRGKGGETVSTVCELAHCPQVPGHCTRPECNQLVSDAVQALENEKLALAMSFDGRVEETKRLVAEIEKECDLEEFSKGSMSSSHATYKAGIEVRPAASACKCSECTQELGISEVESMARRLAAAQDWLVALQKYRSKYDLEFLQSQSGQSTKYAIRRSLQ